MLWLMLPGSQSVGWGLSLCFFFTLCIMSLHFGKYGKWKVILCQLLTVSVTIQTTINCSTEEKVIQFDNCEVIRSHEKHPVDMNSQWIVYPCWTSMTTGKTKFLWFHQYVQHIDWVISRQLGSKTWYPTLCSLLGSYITHQHCTHNLFLAYLAGRERTNSTHCMHIFMHVCVCVSELKWESDKFKRAQSTVPILEQPPSHSAHLTRSPGASLLGYCQSAGVILHN